jgi:ribosomal protein S21
MEAATLGRLFAVIITQTRGEHMSTKELGPIEVDVEDGNVTKARKILRKEMGNEGIIQKMKEKQHYTKPSKKRHDRERRVQREREQEKEENT